MIRNIYTVQQLPMEDLHKIGLAHEGTLLLAEDDLDALLSGRRTDMQRLENLAMDGFRIPLLDAKLSLQPDKEGNLKLLLHPIYAEPLKPEYLTDSEAEALERGETVNLEKTIVDEQGNKREVLIAFDQDTNEFIVIDPEAIEPPEMVNEVPLTAAQKEQFRKGREVETDEGASVQFSAADKNGIRSDRLMLIVSIIVDGGITWALYKGIKAIAGKPQQNETGRNFEEALRRMQETGQQVQSAGLDEEQSETQQMTR